MLRNISKSCVPFANAIATTRTLASWSSFKCPDSKSSPNCFRLSSTPLLSHPVNKELPCGGNVYPNRSYSLYVKRWEKMRQRRPRTPPDITHHYPDYVHEEMPNQEDTEETRAITTDVISNVNQQILDNSHGRLFAVVSVAGKQFKVTPEDIIIVQGYWAPEIGDKLRLEKVLLAGSSDFTLLGRPTLPRDLVNVEATVIEKTLSFTQLHFVLIKRKNHRRLKFFKTPYTMVRINSIEFDGLVNERKEVEGERNTIY